MSSIVKNIVVFGAHGKVGKHFISEVSKSSYKATAVVRNDEQSKNIASLTSNSTNITTKTFTLDELSADEISKAIEGHDAVVFAAGSGGKDLLKIDLDGAVKTFEAAKLAGIRRYVLLSAIHAEDRAFFSKSSLVNYYIAKHYADRILISEFKDSLDFTIVKPTLLTDDEATGKINIIKAKDENTGKVTRADVAKTIFEVLGRPETYGKSFNFSNGDSEISDSTTYENL